MATISDVAKQAKVSKATVSRVLNGVAVKKETRERVLGAMKQLNYRPNAQARGLISGKTNVVGVLVPDMDGPFYGPILEGCQQTLLAYGFNMMVCSTNHKKGSEWTFAKLLLEKRVDGLLILTPREIKDQPMQDFLTTTAEEGFPIVVADGEMETHSISGVWIDNFEGGYRATEHLIDLGHKRIGIVLGTEGAVEGVQRFNGYKRALRNRGLPFDPSLVVSAQGYGYEDGRAIFPQIAEAKPTALFAASDDLAAGLMEAITACGMSIPQDISIIGYDGLSFGALLTPKLTTIRQPLRHLGQIGARKLIKIITREEPEITKIILPTELVVRQSTGPVLTDSERGDGASHQFHRVN